MEYNYICYICLAWRNFENFLQDVTTWEFPATVWSHGRVGLHVLVHGIRSRGKNWPKALFLDIGFQSRLKKCLQSCRFMLSDTQE